MRARQQLNHLRVQNDQVASAVASRNSQAERRRRRRLEDREARHELL